MVQAIISISKRANRVINLVKAKYDLRDKSQAIEKLVEEYEYEVLERPFKPEYVEKLKRYQKEKKYRVPDVEAWFASMRK
ncbi:MAG TPA: DUF2683 family protein [Candidatus Diapherotrites archaeon]|uniref:DUF2683 family protein n=1 Tax=Candidatus Iainarchaeum sp. TaxID=3101447 RepID=A0A7J4JJR9_9ARCH|nr:DUF2683 family protein [Candidatus Diapherotrites archaeon]HIH16187.1 DUF2683 family protein [Candidatus Diapherotrites archaeon]